MKPFCCCCCCVLRETVTLRRSKIFIDSLSLCMRFNKILVKRILLLIVIQKYCIYSFCTWLPSMAANSFNVVRITLKRTTLGANGEAVQLLLELS